MFINLRPAFSLCSCFLFMSAFPLIGKSQAPLPPDSVYAQVLGPDSAIYVSWQAPDSGGLVLEAYNIYRLSDFDPEGDPETGVQTFFLSHNWPACSDPEWPELDYGWYAYGIEAAYTNGMVSEMAVSNIVGHDMFCSLNLTVSLETGEPAGIVHTELMGEDYSYEKYFGKDSALTHFDSVLRGHYLVGAYHTGFDTGYLQNALINSDTTVNLFLGQRKRPVYDLEVDPVSLMATWSPPALVALYEDFEGEQFPPAGWQVSTEGVRTWHRTLDGSTGEFLIPPGDNYYACEIDQGKGMLNESTGRSDNDGCCDYLITPPLDLTQSDNYQLDFYSFYEAGYGELAFVEYSFDQGETWEVLHELSPHNIWVTLEVPLSTLCGQNSVNPVWLAFHADDAGGWGTGWAVDNVKIYVPSSQVEYTDFNVYLEDTLISATTNTSWNYAPLNYGQQYVASVSVNYPYGTSKKDYYPFTSRYLPPPLDFTAQVDESDVTLQWNPPTDRKVNNSAGLKDVPENLYGFKIYKDDILLVYVEHTGIDEPQVYIDSNNYPGFFDYELSGIYDLEPYGFPGDTGESMRIGPMSVSVDYCTALDFHEDWASGNFTENLWQTNTDEWHISEDTGNPAPCAVFMPDSILSNYSAPLMSYPLCGHLLSEGQIWLDFDLNLISNNNTGNEKLKVQVWSWDLNSWTTKKEYSNGSGNISWTREHCYINAYAMDDIFRVRFVAEGFNSSDIEKWSIDNIDIHRFCPGPDSLFLEVIPEESSIVLNWTGPEPYYFDTLLFWGDGACSGNSTGTGGPVEFDVAQRWEPQHLQELSGGYITEVAFYPCEALSDYNVRIWTGEGAANLVYDQAVSPEIGQWHVHTLDIPIAVDSDQELWIGYYVNAETGYPAGMDDGPAVDGYGNMMNWGGWQTLQDVNPALDYNWCINATVRTTDNKKISLSPQRKGKMKSDKTRDLSGYNIYRKIGLNGGYELIDFVTEGPCIYTVMM
ncbi:MAG: hypothetical protein HGA23_01550, partial [Bacteroidales bacterium]|nr:hypothetical protein [Bacteroidales bacterium]